MGLTSSSEHKHTLLIRPIEITDINEQYFDLLSGLYRNRKNFLQAETFFHSLDAQHHIIVVENPTNHLLIGTGTIFIEPKIIHNFGFVGHIEDVVVHPDYQGYGVGSKIIEKLKQYGDENGCYKCILDCTDDKIPFYQKCGFSLKGTQMSYYYDKKNQVK